MFTLKLDADACGTSGRGEICLPPRALVERFGPPKPFDNYKISGEYVFVDGDGNVYTLYDWKSTSLYNDGEWPNFPPAFPTPEELWAGAEAFEFHIGAGPDADVAAFARWLAGEVARVTT